MRAKRVWGRPRGWVVAVAVTLTAFAAPAVALLSAAPSGATGTFTMDVAAQSNTSLTWLVSNIDTDPSLTCTDSNLAVTVVAGPSSTPVTPTSAVVQSANEVLVTLPAGTPSPVTFSGSCLNGENPISAIDGPLGFATLNVAKVVQGSDPGGDSFTVALSCLGTTSTSSANGFGSGSSSEHSATVATPSSGNLQYGAAGGTSPFYVYEASTCTVTETNAGGAASTTITPNPVDVEDPIPYSVTVTNVFPAAAIVVAPEFTG